MLEHADAALRDDRHVVRAAVKQNGEALQFASRRLRKNLDLAAAAVRRSPAAYYHTEQEIRGPLFQFAPWEERASRETVLALVADAPLALEFAAWSPWGPFGDADSKDLFEASSRLYQNLHKMISISFQILSPKMIILAIQTTDRFCDVTEL